MIPNRDGRARTARARAIVTPTRTLLVAGRSAMIEIDHLDIVSVRIEPAPGIRRRVTIDVATRSLTWPRLSWRDGESHGVRTARALVSAAAKRWLELGLGSFSAEEIDLLDGLAEARPHSAWTFPASAWTTLAGLLDD